MILFTKTDEAVEYVRKFNIVCKNVYVTNGCSGTVELGTIEDKFSIENATFVSLEFLKDDKVAKASVLLLPTDMLADFFAKCEEVLVTNDKAMHLVDGEMKEFECGNKGMKMINNDDDMMRFMHDAHLLASVRAGHSDIDMKMGIALRESKIDGSTSTVAVAIGFDKKTNKELKPLSMVISDEYAPTLFKNLENGKVTSKDGGISVDNITHANDPTNNKVFH